MIAAVILAFVPTSLEFEVLPRPLAWEELGPETFDRNWSLPERRRGSGEDLLAEIDDLLAFRFELPADGADEPPLRCAGDLIAAARKIGGAKRAKWLEKKLAGDRRLATRWGEELRQLLLDDQLRSGRWNPEEDSARDGFLLGEPWNLDSEGIQPWTNLGGAAIAEQGAVLVRADLAEWKKVENDYRSYPKMIGADYEAIHPFPGTYRRGEDPEGRPFASLSIYFQCDLPFPFSDYSCDLRILNRVDGKGRTVTDIYSTSDDFHWMAGRDVFVPVIDSGGDRVAYIVVRTFGFDLDGVPDRREHRQAGMRQGMCNLKIRAEALWGAREDADPPTAETVPEFRVLGRR